MTDLLPGQLIEQLPIFPLPNLVFFPETLLPLHVFEPRYLALVDHVLEHGRLMGVATLAPGWQTSYYERPELLPVLTVGRLVRKEQADEGRCNILVRGLARVRVVDELAPELLFRRVSAEVLPTPEPNEGLDRELAAIRQLFGAMLARMPGQSAGTAAGLFNPEVPPRVLLNTIATALPLDPERKHAILAADTLAARAELLSQELAELTLAGDTADA